MGRPAHGSDNFRFTNPRKLNENDSVARTRVLVSEFAIAVSGNGQRGLTYAY